MRKRHSAVVVTLAAASMSFGGTALSGCASSSSASRESSEPTHTQNPPRPASGAGESSAPASSEGPATGGEPAGAIPPPRNPPAPNECPVEGTLVVGDTCDVDGQICYPREGCGLNGWRCDAGHWRQLHTFCNPPRR